MNPRELLLRIAVGGSVPLLAPLSGHAAEYKTGSSLFKSGEPRWQSAFATADDDYPLTAAKVRGRFPDAVAGSLYRNGPAGHDLGGMRYHHWFDGDGMVQRFVIAGTEVHHQGRYVATAKRTSEVKAGRRLSESFGTVTQELEMAISPDSMNAANISVFPVGGDLLALWEGGSAIRLDPLTLETRGIKTWRPDLMGAPFSAHPKVEADGTIWNFGVSSNSGSLLLYEIGPDGVLKRADAFPVSAIPMVHDFAVTSDHLVFLLPPLVSEVQRRAAGASILDAYVWQPEKGMRALVIDKENWKRQQYFELPTGFLFHLGNAWEETSGSRTSIHLDYARSDDARELLVDTRDVMRGRLSGTPGPRLTVVSLHLGTGKATQTNLGIEAEFMCIDQRLIGRQHRQIFHATSAIGGLPMWSAIACTNVETGVSQRFSYGSNAIVEEHLYVPDGQGPGWVLGTVFDHANKNTVLSCFAANALSDGPVAQAVLPYALPLGLHGAFVAKP